MARYRLRLSYDGGPFRGFAENEGVATVGATLREALERFLQHPVTIVCAGRTDAGVHALDQVVSFDSERVIDAGALRASLNGLCKPHIVVHLVERVDDTFDARFSCTGRSYRYRILNRRLPDPFRHNYTWRVARPLDVDVMNAAGACLIGTHDFSSFCRRQFESSDEVAREKTRVRELRRLRWTHEADDEVHLEISASSFCQQMVRSIVGLSVDVGLGSVALDHVPAILSARDRTQVLRVAPPQGLFLLRVDYPSAAVDL